MSNEDSKELQKRLDSEIKSKTSENLYSNEELLQQDGKKVDPYDAVDAAQKFISFADNIDAKNYQIKIEKYGELDFYDLENKARELVFN